MSFQVSQSLTFWVSRLATTLQEQFNKDLEAFDITWPQWMLLNVLHHNASNTPAYVAQQLGIDRSAVTRLADRLEKKGLLVREHDTLDRRSIKLLITEPGKMILTMMDKAAAVHHQQFVSQLHATEYQAMKGSLQKLLKAGGVESAALWNHT